MPLASVSLKRRAEVLPHPFETELKQVEKCPPVPDPECEEIHARGDEPAGRSPDDSWTDC